MSHTITKLSGSAGAVLKYLEEESTRAFEYYAEDKSNDPDALAFSRVWGNGAAELGLELGLTRQQFVDLFNGSFDGQQLVKLNGYRFVYEQDEDGKLLLDDYGDKIHVMVQETTRTGKPKFDQLGHPILKKKTESAHTGAVDIPLGTPKSLAVKMVQADDALREAIDAAVLRAAYATAMAIQDTAKVARVVTKEKALVGASKETKQQGSDTERTTGGWIFVPTIGRAARDTTKSRSRRDPIPDPQLHVHLTALSPILRPDGTWGTLDMYGLTTDAVRELAEATWMGELARGLEDLGIQLEYTEWDHAKNGRISWEIADVDQGLCREWSTNSDRMFEMQVDYEREHNRPISRQRLSDLMRNTRLKKSELTKLMDTRPAYERWLQQAADLGYKLAPAHIKPPLYRVSYEMRRRALANRLLGPNGFHRTQAEVEGEMIAAHVAQCAVGLGFEPTEVKALEAEFRASLVVIEQGPDDGSTRYATQKQIHGERTLNKALDKRVDKLAPVPSASAVRWAISRAKVPLDTEQRDALQIATSGHRVTVIQGVAGAGKSTLLKTLKAAYEAEGISDKWIVGAYAANIGEEIGRKVGADRYGSIDSVIWQLKNGGRPTERTVVVIDEAWMASTEQMVRLERAIGDAHLVLLGDAAQLPSIGPSGFMREFVAKHPNRVATLTTTHRHKDARDVRDYGLIRLGGKPVERALENLSMRDRVHISDTHEDRVGEAFERYVEAREHGYTASEVRFLLDGNNQTVDLLNRLVQNHRQSLGEIKTEGFHVQDKFSGRRWTIHEGDEITFQRSYKKLGQKAIKNGVSGTVLSVDNRSGKVQLATSDDQIVSLTLKAVEDTQVIAPNYACHVTRYQGSEVPIALCIPAGPTVTTNNSGYTMLTRGQKESHLFLDRQSMPRGTKDLAVAWAEPEVRKTATFILGQVEHRDVEAEEVFEQWYESEQERPQDRTPEIDRDWDVPEPDWTQDFGLGL
jgi:AAA domain/TrwC relaxase